MIPGVCLSICRLRSVIELYTSEAVLVVWEYGIHQMYTSDVPIIFSAEEHHRLLAGTKLYCLVTEAHRCEQLAQGCYAAFVPSRIWTHDMLSIMLNSEPIFLFIWAVVRPTDIWSATFLINRWNISFQLPIEFVHLLTNLYILLIPEDVGHQTLMIYLSGWIFLSESCVRVTSNEMLFKDCNWTRYRPRVNY